MDLTWIGEWRDDDSPQGPRPEDLVDRTWDDQERAACSDYLRSGPRVAYALGAEQCLICGSDINDDIVSDGVFVWGAGLAHYVSVHSVRPPSRIVGHAIANEVPTLSGNALDAIGSAIRTGRADRLWWNAATARD